MKITRQIIAKEDARYQAFPDIAMTKSGKLITMFRNSDKHVAEESKLYFACSDDQGETWSKAAVFFEDCGHMPRLTTLKSGEIVVIDDGAPPNWPQALENVVQTRIFTSNDDGESFTEHVLDPGFPRTIPECPTFAPDRILEISENEWIALGQVRLGKMGKKHGFAIFVYRSLDRGATWEADEIAACIPSEKITEPSAVRLSEDTILGVYRDNIMGAPSRWNTADGFGRNWTELKEAPFCGHRPTAGVLSDGRILVTYRKTDAPRGTAAWLGTYEQFMNGDKSCEFMIDPVAEGIPGGDFGYSGWVEVSAGVVYVVYHTSDVKGEKSYICGAKIDLNVPDAEE